MTTIITDRDTLLDIVAQGHDGYRRQVDAFMDNVLGRGDSVLVYRNEDLGHPDLGDCRTLSYGSPAAYLEASQFQTPPTTMPDTPHQVNWRYQLIGRIDP